MRMARHLAGWMAAGALASAVAATGVLAATPDQMPAAAPEPVPVAAPGQVLAAAPEQVPVVTPHQAPAAPAGLAARGHTVPEVMRQIQEARPQLTEEQWQEWLKATEQILTTAIQEGRLTPEQAEQIRSLMAAHKAGVLPEGRFGGRHPGFWHGGRGGRGGRGGHHGQPLTPEQRQQRLERLKARLDQAVKDGKLTREQADHILQHMTERMQRLDAQPPR